MKTNVESEIKNTIFQTIQTFLKTPPIVIWGSGATISFGMPSMNDLNDLLKANVVDFDSTNTNLEVELGKDKYQPKMPEIRKLIWQKIEEADSKVLEEFIVGNIEKYNGIKRLIQIFTEPHPKVLNIVTTNYDRVLEYCLSYFSHNFTDGFNGKYLSIFNPNLFGAKDIVNIIKVHGSLSWFNIDSEARYLFGKSHDSPLIIAPGKSKFQETYNSPYRELIQKSDNVISEAKSILVVGFGFNDEHLTPKIKSLVKKDVPIVLITKKISDTTIEELKGATKYVLIEEHHSSTKFIYKTSLAMSPQETILSGNYWSLNNFLEILL